MKIPFVKAHGAKNDFLLTWDVQAPLEDPPGLARAICADGWLLLSSHRPSFARRGNLKVAATSGHDLQVVPWLRSSHEETHEDPIR